MTKTARTIFFCLALTVSFSCANSQISYADLIRIDVVSETVYASKGHEELGIYLANLVAGANNYMSALVGMPAPKTTILILSQEDWGKFTNPGIIYGMPHYGGADGTTLVVAAEDNAFWRANMPPLDQLPPHLQQMFRNVYTNEDGELSSRPFFDLLVLHELGHGWTGYHRIKRQRFWLEEVFVNVFLHTYIAEEQSHLLPGLEVLPMLSAVGNRDRFHYTTLSQFEEGYWIIGREAPVNYGWYQFRFHFSAKQVYDQAGAIALKNLWDFMAGHTDILDQEALLNGLYTKVHPAMADVYRKWDE
jgi:hypothetical protein